METNSASLWEMFVLILFLGAVAYILWIVFQVLIMYLNKDKPKTFSRVTALLILTRICTIAFSLLIWKFWFLRVDVMLGPILLPALMSEIVISPIFLKFFGYKILRIS